MNTKGKVKRSRLRVKDKKKILLVGVTVLMVLLCFTSTFFVIRSFLKVKTFELSGITQYDKSTLAGASGINIGDRIYAADLDAAEQRILEQFPYIQNIKIERTLTGKIIFRVEERTASWYMQVSGDYYALDATLKVIEETPKNDKFVQGGVTYLVLPNLKMLMCGSVPEFGNDDVEVIKTLELISAIQSDPLKTRITSLDIESRFNVYLVIDGIYNVYIGDMSNVSEKLLVIGELLNSGDLLEFAGADIDVSNPESMIVKPKYQ